MLWRDELKLLANSIPRDEVSDAIGELEALKSRLLARLLTPNGASAPESPDRYLTPQDVAKLLKVDVRWAYRHRRELGGVSLSDRCLRFPAAAIAAYLEQLTP